MFIQSSPKHTQIYIAYHTIYICCQLHDFQEEHMYASELTACARMQQQQSALTLARALNLSILLCATSLNVLLTAHHSTGRRGTEGTGEGGTTAQLCLRPLEMK